MAFKPIALFSAAAFAGLAPQAHAQAPAANGGAAVEQSSSEAAESEEIIVTGSNIRGVAAVGSPGIVIGREDIEESGLTTPSQVLQTLPQLQSNSSFSGEQPAQANPYVGSNITGGALFNNESRGNSADIRGLGPNATLVLVDGRRQVPSGTVASFTETNLLPLAALERIEVVTDGASAVYGSNAIGGVINYITRKDYEGLEVSGRYSTNDLYDSRGGSIVGGQAWELGGRQGNVLASYDHNERDNVSYADDPRIGTDLTAFGGANGIYSSFESPAPTGDGYYVSRVCPPGFLDFGFPGLACYDPVTYVPGFVDQYFDVTSLSPSGAPTGVASAGEFPANSLASTDAFRDYMGETESDAFNVYINQDITSAISVYYQGSYSRREESIRNYSVNALNVTDASPFFPLNAPTGVTSVVAPVGIASTAQVLSTSYAHTVGARWAFANDWQAEGYTSWSRSRSGTVGTAGRSPDPDILNYLILSGDYNPFLPMSADIRASATTTEGKAGSYSRANGTDTVLRFDGPIGELPGGGVRGAFGFQYTNQGNDYLYYSQNTQTCAGLTPPTPCTPLEPVLDTERSEGATRNVRAAFAELYVPVIGHANQLPLIQSLNLSLATRWEDYSDFGETTNSRIGFTWDVVDDLSVRGSWGTAFRAPNLIEMSANFIGYVGPGTNNTGGLYGPDGPTQVVILGGGNPELQPEESTNYTLGFDFEPAWLEGLRLSATYYNIDYTNKIQALDIARFLDSPTSGALYADFIDVVANPNPPGCSANDPSTWAPEIQAVLINEPRNDAVCLATLILDGRWVNASSVVQDGMDVDLRYTWDNELGQFNAGVTLSKIFGIDEEVVAGRQTVPEPLNRTFRPLDFRARATLGWNRGPWDANLFVNYTPSYTHDLPITPQGPDGPLPTLPITEVDSWVTADVGLSYRSVLDEDAFTSGFRIGLNVQNVTDEDPPVVLIGNQAFDARNHSLFGRIVTLQVTKEF